MTPSFSSFFIYPIAPASASAFTRGFTPGWTAEKKSGLLAGN
jgi:hypothetical protein